MPAQQRAHSENLLLAALGEGDRALLEAHFDETPLKLRDVLAQANSPIEHVYFPLHGVASVVTTAGAGTPVEVGIFGRDGMSAPSLVLGVEQTPHETFIQVPGRGLRIDAAVFSSALRQSRSLHDALLRYVQALAVQTAHTAVANGRFTIEERLARWLLMCHDRVNGDVLPLTHEFLSLMLAVRRAGVTVAVQTLEGAGLIRADRGLITVLDRTSLEEFAEGSYGAPEAEYERLIAPIRRRRQVSSAERT